MTELVLSSVLIVLHEYLDTFSSRWTVAKACSFGLSRRALEYLAVRDPDWGDGDNAVQYAVAKGYVHVLQWLNDCYPERTLWGCEVRHWPGLSCLMDLAVRFGQLPALRWLHANRSENCTPEAMDVAATIGRLDIIQFLHEHRTEGCTTRAMVNAAHRGHLDVVKWLHTHHGSKCTKAAIDSAAKYGQLEIVKWLYTNCSEGRSAKAMKIAAAFGRLGIVRFLYENRSEGDIPEALHVAAMYGQNDVARYLSTVVQGKKGGDAIICKAAEFALEYDHTELCNLLGCQRLQS